MFSGKHSTCCENVLTTGGTDCGCDAGIIHPDLSLDEITTDIRMIVIGNVFEWCLKSGDADFEGNMKRSLETYLNGLFS